MSDIRLNPQCFNIGFPMAVTNTGYLLPCCYCDDPYTLKNLEFQKLMAVSKISEHDTLDEIVCTSEWKDFEENLRNHKGPPACVSTCRVREDKNNIVRKDTWIDPENGTIEYVRKV